MSATLCKKFNNININKTLIPGTIFSLNNTICQFIGYNMNDMILYQIYNNNTVCDTILSSEYQENISNILYEPLQYYKMKTFDL